MALPDVREKLDTLGFVTVANTPDQFAARLKAEFDKWEKVIKAAGIKVE